MRGIRDASGTTNDEGNAPMRGIDARLGYAPEPPVVEVANAAVPEG